MNKKDMTFTIDYFYRIVRTIQTRFVAILQLLNFVICISLAVYLLNAHADDSEMNQKLVLRPGDVIAQKAKDGWHTIKVLAVDQWPDGTSTAHCLIYNPFPNKPSLISLKQAGVRIWHAPINAGSFKAGWELLGNQPPSKDELIGFIEYLKQTDFIRYASFTEQDPKEIIRRANEHYRRAYSLGDQGNRTEAIAEYSKAIELFPQFYEAIDNRGFIYMELGKYQAALSNFESSLRVNPDGIDAFFSRGECLMNLGDLAEAEAIFLEGKTRFPEQSAMFERFLNHVRNLRK